ncbi:dihydrolipoyllysine-residue acetyltransferase [Arenicella chitinivorans]
MSNSETIEISVPDIGADSAKVVEILVQVGDQIAVDDPLVTLESDKASMDVPSTHAGVVKSVSVSIDQDVNQGVAILTLESNTPSASEPPEETTQSATTAEKQPTAAEPSPVSNSSGVSKVEVKIPDIGGDSAKVVEILVEAGQQVALEESLITLESDKASMDVPSSVAGIIQSISVAIGDEVSEGVVIAVIESQANEASSAPKAADETATAKASAPATKPVSEQNVAPAKPVPTSMGKPNAPAGQSHASPSIRRFARELGVDLSKVTGTGRKQRVTKDDVKAYVKSSLQSGAANATTSGSGIPPIPAQDFSKFGEIELQPLNKIKRLTAENLHRSWVNVPHVTHNDESDISDLESFRKQLNGEYAKQGKDIKLSPLAFIVKAVVNAMQEYPQFNSSLEPGGENLILKKYFNIGIAVDTPNGLVVPVVKDADKKSVAEIAREMGELAKKARDKKLTMNDMSGACFTISSLGGIGGTGFTPIVNAPEVAILGVSRSSIKPVWNGSEFVPGTMLPLSLSYDHRVIDGAEAARFTHHIAKVLEDVRRLTV